MAKLKVTKSKPNAKLKTGRHIAGKLKVGINKGMQKTVDPTKKTSGYATTEYRTVRPSKKKK